MLLELRRKLQLTLELLYLHRQRNPVSVNLLAPLTLVDKIVVRSQMP